MEENQDDIDLIASALILPNGVTVPNRLIKAAMEEGIGQGGGLPGAAHRRLYTRWAHGGWGMIITGNVQIDESCLATGHDRTFPANSQAAKEAWSQVSSIITTGPSNSPPSLAIMQISHAGLQSSSTINFSRAPWRSSIAPISARPDLGPSALGWLMSRFIWPVKSREVKDAEEWLRIVDRFVEVARDAEQAGWNGVQIHSAHGYLLAEYLSSLTNPAPVSLPNVPSHIPVRLHLLYLVLTKVASSTRSSFVKSVKINCSDFVQGGMDETRSAEVIREIVSWRLVDILEISGGNYVNPAFAALDGITTSHPTRQSLFSHFTTSLLPTLPSSPEGPAIILTGALHTRSLIASSLRTRACDLVGIGRPACIKPELPRDIILNREIEEERAVVGGYRIPGGETMKRLLGGGRTVAVSPKISSYLEAETLTEIPGEDSPLLSKSIQSSGEKSSGIPLVGAGISTFWHEWQMSRIGRGMQPDMEMDWLWGGLIVEWFWWGLLGGGPLGWWHSRQGLC